MQYLDGRFFIVKVLLGAFNKASPCTVKFREVRLTALRHSQVWAGYMDTSQYDQITETSVLIFDF